MSDCNPDVAVMQLLEHPLAPVNTHWCELQVSHAAAGSCIRDKGVAVSFRGGDQVMWRLFRAALLTYFPLTFWPRCTLGSSPCRPTSAFPVCSDHPQRCVSICHPVFLHLMFANQRPSLALAPSDVVCQFSGAHSAATASTGPIYSLILSKQWRTVWRNQVLLRII